MVRLKEMSNIVDKIAGRCWVDDAMHRVCSCWKSAKSCVYCSIYSRVHDSSLQ